MGPLHGVPITLKDQFDVEGYDSTIGYVSRTLRPAKEDAALVRILNDLGAVIIAKTNLPQSIMVMSPLQVIYTSYSHIQWCETENPIWGLTVNPLNKAFTPGGSSGGEGALLALHGSIIGYGTDLGGSVRIPSHINGLYGLKPTVRFQLAILSLADYSSRHLVFHIMDSPSPPMDRLTYPPLSVLWHAICRHLSL